MELIKNQKQVFEPWYLLDIRQNILIHFKDLQKRYLSRKLFPFARQDGNDDIAWWEEDKPGKIVIIHDFASPGWEQREILDNFEDWYQFALSEGRMSINNMEELLQELGEAKRERYDFYFQSKL